MPPRLPPPDTAAETRARIDRRRAAEGRKAKSGHQLWLELALARLRRPPSSS